MIQVLTLRLHTASTFINGVLRISKNHHLLRRGLLSLLLIGFYSPLQANMLTYTGSFNIFNTGALAEFNISDTFDFMFTIDHSQLDIVPSLTAGQFPIGTVLNTSLTKTGGTGTWDPAGGTFGDGYALTQSSTTTHRFSTASDASGLPTANGLSFSSIQFSFSVPDTTSPINDTGVGQTLEAQLGGLFDPADFTSGNLAFLVFDSGISDFATGNINNISAVPIPAALPLFGSALSLMGFMVWRQRKQQA